MRNELWRALRLIWLRSVIAALVLAAAPVMLLGLPSPGPDLHGSYDALLDKHVDANGRVAYRSIEKESSAELAAYLKSLETVDPSALSEQEQIAFWINAYNARVIRGILDGYRADGFLARKRFFSWYSFPLAGKERSLDEIEHEILRKQFSEPRIHFALVCASTSCPKLRREAYRGDQLDAQLDDQTRGFLSDPTRNQIGPGDVIKISSIFDWFEEDFVAAAGSVPAYLERYRSIQEDTEIDYLDYDWTLNAQPGEEPD